MAKDEEVKKKISTSPELSKRAEVKEKEEKLSSVSSKTSSFKNSDCEKKDKNIFESPSTPA